ncbi:cupin domain-containing protein [Microbulbifer sp. A4B17]|uniref:cupin domain-containing protein n=1 Tax=Microbulbifer sp. A4B17 TaxID=359370 RepID=UPI000D52CB1E|nr:cupin domain-containing protein [Microbulbifer sp. A4B17]AWF81092.1 cupin domain-containing protein [Microbulbifer sp. A4B17]
MSVNVRRVVTGHDSEGKPVVLMDDRGLHTSSWRPQMNQQQLWTTQDLPVDLCEDGKDKGGRSVAGTTIPGGSVFKIVEFGPGVTPRSHQTDSIDYAVVISGDIEMELGDDVVVKLSAGDTLVQRGTVHNWVNRGDKPCLIAFVLISSTGNTAFG